MLECPGALALFPRLPVRPGAAEAWAEPVADLGVPPPPLDPSEPSLLHALDAPPDDVVRVLVGELPEIVDAGAVAAVGVETELVLDVGDGVETELVLDVGDGDETELVLDVGDDVETELVLDVGDGDETELVLDVGDGVEMATGD